MNLFIALLLVLAVPPAWAQEPSKVDYDQMKEFMRQENERMKAIKILSLDLERADLELRKRQIEVKLSELNKNNPAFTAGMSADFSQPVLRLSGIFIGGDSREALVNVKGINIQVSEGKPIEKDIVLKKIGTDHVLLEHTGGKQEALHLGS